MVQETPPVAEAITEMVLRTLAGCYKSVFLSDFVIEIPSRNSHELLQVYWDAEF